MPVPEDVTKHLEFVQNVIARMAGNSFLLKGWTVTLSAALFALAAKDSNPLFAVIALVPAIAFWSLDAFYLRLERMYRCLYDNLRKATDEELRGVEPFSMAVDQYSEQVDGLVRTMFTGSVLGLHGTLVLTIAVVILYLVSKG